MTPSAPIGPPNSYSIERTDEGLACLLVVDTGFTFVFFKGKLLATLPLFGAILQSGKAAHRAEREGPSCWNQADAALQRLDYCSYSRFSTVIQTCCALHRGYWQLVTRFIRWTYLRFYTIFLRGIMVGLLDIFPHKYGYIEAFLQKNIPGNIREYCSVFRVKKNILGIHVGSLWWT